MEERGRKRVEEKKRKRVEERGRKKEGGRKRKRDNVCVRVCVRVCVFVCACVKDSNGERKRERETGCDASHPYTNASPLYCSFSIRT